jgi:hypothetical protein
VPAIMMIGPHAVGKTAAARRWAALFPRLRVVVCDNRLEIVGGREVRVREWKSTERDKQAVMRAAVRDSSCVTLVESGRGFSVLTACLGSEDSVIVLTCPEPAGRRWIEERRKGRGNEKPLSDYWTTKRLDYECNGYLLNHAAKNLRPAQWKHFVIADRARDWPAVDEHFERLYMRIHNRLVCERRAAAGRAGQ